MKTYTTIANRRPSVVARLHAKAQAVMADAEAALEAGDIAKFQSRYAEAKALLAGMDAQIAENSMKAK